MNDLISGEDVLDALSKGVSVIYIDKEMVDTGAWSNPDDIKSFSIQDLFSDQWLFKVKPKTMLLDGVEVPEPFKPKFGDDYYFIANYEVDGFKRISYTGSTFDYNSTKFGAWRTEGEVREVVNVLRSIFGDLS